MDANTGALIEAVIATDVTTKTIGSAIAGSAMAGAIYAAYSFYQARKGEELAPEEMKEIKDAVLNEIAGYAAMYGNVLNSSDS